LYDCLAIIIGTIGIALNFPPVIYLAAMAHLIANFCMALVKWLWPFMEAVTLLVAAVLFFAALYAVQVYYQGLPSDAVVAYLKTSWLQQIASAIVVGGVVSNLLAYPATLANSLSTRTVRHHIPAHRAKSGLCFRLFASSTAPRASPVVHFLRCHRRYNVLRHRHAPTAEALRSGFIVHLNLMRSTVSPLKRQFMNVDSWLSILSICLSVGLPIAIFIARHWLLARITKSVQHTFDVQIERLRAELREKEAEISALRNTVLSGSANRQSLLDKRRFEAVEKVWAAVNDLGELQGTSKNSFYSPDATKLPPNDSASFSFRFIYVHSRAVRDR
jgi:hypothetical protein